MIFNQGKTLVRVPLDRDIPGFTLPMTHTDVVKKIEFDFVRGYLYWLNPEKLVLLRSLEDGKQFKVIKLQHDNTSMENAPISPYDFSLDAYSNTIFWTDEKQNTVNFYHLNTSANGTVIRQNEKTKHLYFPRKIVVFPKNGRMYFTSVKTHDLPGVYRTSILDSNYAGTDIKEVKSFQWEMNIVDLKLDFVEERLYWLEASHKFIYSVSIYGTDLREYSSKYMSTPVSIGISGHYLYWADNLYNKKTSKMYRTFKNKTTGNGMEFLTLSSQLKGMVTINMTRKNGECTGWFILFFIFSSQTLLNNAYYYLKSSYPPFSEIEGN